MAEAFLAQDSVSLTISLCIGALILLVLLIVQAKNTYYDLFTQERKSIRPRTSMPPKITSSYKMANFCTLGCIFFYFLTGIALVGESILVQFRDSGNCENLWSYYFWQHVVSTIAFNFSKLCLYLTLLARLHLSYYKSRVSFSARTLKFWAVFLCIYAIVLTILGCLMLSPTGDFCEAGNKLVEPYISIFMGLYIINELGTAIGFTLSYVLPLRKLLKLLDENKLAGAVDAECAADDDDDITTGTMYYLAVKTTTLEVIQTVSSLVAIIIAYLTYIATDGVSINLMGIDAVLNCVCLVLMSNYYEDVKYYQRLCWPCIKCCDPTSEAYRTKIKHIPENTAEVEIPDMTAAKTTSAEITDA